MKLLLPGLLLGSAFLYSACSGSAIERIPVEDMGGHQTEFLTGKISWSANSFEFPETVMVYRTTPGEDQTELVRNLAKELGFEETRPVLGSPREGAIGFRGEGYDRNLHYNPRRGEFSLNLQDWTGLIHTEEGQPNIDGVPTREEAYDLALSLLGKYGLSKDDFWQDNETGKLAHGLRRNRVGFTNKATGERERIYTNTAIIFERRVGPYRVDGFGTGGQAEFTFVSHGELARVYWSLRGAAPAGEYPVVGKAELWETIKGGQAFSDLPVVQCEGVIIQKVELCVYDTNADIRRRHFTPVYLIWCEIIGGDMDGQEILLRVPALQMHN